jgi:hypothetical protein
MEQVIERAARDQSLRRLDEELTLIERTRAFVRSKGSLPGMRYLSSRGRDAVATEVARGRPAPACPGAGPAALG